MQLFRAKKILLELKASGFAVVSGPLSLGV
jgi:hypothetical protein